MALKNLSYTLNYCNIASGYHNNHIIKGHVAMCLFKTEGYGYGRAKGWNVIGP